MSKPFLPIVPASIQWNGNKPKSDVFDDIYFSGEDGLNESKYVFFDANNLTERFKNHKSDGEFVIGELGFGSGLNFLITWHQWLKYRKTKGVLHFISCEKHPLKVSDLKKTLSGWTELTPYAQQLIQQYPVLTPGYHHVQFDSGRVKLTIMLGDAVDCLKHLTGPHQNIINNTSMPKKIDAWFLDGFAPSKNPDMWSQDLLNTLGYLSSKHTTLSTFTAAGHVKRGLEYAGFEVRKTKGFGKKRDMLKAKFYATPAGSVKMRTPWAFPDYKKPNDKSAIVIGAGISGCLISRELALKGWQVHLVDEQRYVASAASGNEQAVIFPNISAYNSPLTNFMLASFLDASAMYKPLVGSEIEGELKGVIQLLNKLDDKQLNSLNNWLSFYPDLATILSKDKASSHSGLRINTQSLWIPSAGWINCKKLCQYLIAHPNINYEGGKKIENIEYINNQWTVGSLQAETLVLSCGVRTNAFKQTSFLPFKPIRGQLSFLVDTPNTSKLSVPICGDGHVLPSIRGKHVIGATYELNVDVVGSKEVDNLKNLQKLNNMPIDITWGNQIISDWSGIRAVTPDYMPIVGAVPVYNDFIQTYKPLAKNAKKPLYESPPVYPGLFVMAGFGSRGLTSAPLCAKWLSTIINQDFSFLPNQMIESLSPARFLIRSIIQGKI